MIPRDQSQLPVDRLNNDRSNFFRARYGDKREILSKLVWEKPGVHVGRAKPGGDHFGRLYVFDETSIERLLIAEHYGQQPAEE